MGTIITSIILVIITVTRLGFKKEGFKTKDRFGDEKTEYKKVFKFRPRMLLGLGWLMLILFECFASIPANSVGIEYDPLNGGIQEGTLQEGFKTKNPLSTIYVISTKVMELQFENVSVQTNDSQWVNAIIQVQVNIDKNKASTYFSKYGDKSLEDIKSVINSTIQKQFESVTVKYNIMELLGKKRNDIVNETYQLAYDELYKDGIVLNRLVLVDTDAGDTIEKAIADEAVAKKNVDTAAYKKQQAELEGEAKVIEAQKQKEANDLLSKSLTDEILMEQFIEKWSGQLPYVVSDGSTIFDINSLIK